MILSFFPESDAKPAALPGVQTQEGRFAFLAPGHLAQGRGGGGPEVCDAGTPCCKRPDSASNSTSSRGVTGAPTQEGKTALMWAAANGVVAMTELLLTRGADAEAKADVRQMARAASPSP